jgi:hypothetical protein
MGKQEPFGSISLLFGDQKRNVVLFLSRLTAHAVNCCVERKEVKELRYILLLS